MTAYLAYLPQTADIDAIEVDGAMFPLDDHLMLVRTEQTRSRLYHALKRQMPEDAAILVAPLEDAPKFKGMRQGALAAARRLFPQTG